MNFDGGINITGFSTMESRVCSQKSLALYSGGLLVFCSSTLTNKEFFMLLLIFLNVVINSTLKNTAMDLEVSLSSKRRDSDHLFGFS